jgi:hypothetical protein
MLQLLSLLWNSLRAGIFSEGKNFFLTRFSTGKNPLLEGLSALARLFQAGLSAFSRRSPRRFAASSGKILF